MAALVTVSRHWNNPQILSKVNLEGIVIGMLMKDFIIALKLEMGVDVSDKKIDEGINKVLEKMKEESSKGYCTGG